MKLQIFSDLHLEFHKTYPKIVPIANIIILAGDIGFITNTNYLDFLDYISSNWEIVILILGNHEYYSKKYHMNKLTTRYHDLFHKYSNFVFLNNTKVQLIDNDTGKEWDILGSTLWSNISSSCNDDINCLKQITIYNSDVNRKYPITKSQYNDLHSNSKSWLINNYNPNNNTIIITHYPIRTTFTCHDKYSSDSPEIRAKYANYIDFEPANSSINLIAIAGHTHLSYDVIEAVNKRFISNQYGYPSEYTSNETKYNPDGLFII